MRPAFLRMEIRSEERLIFFTKLADYQPDMGISIWNILTCTHCGKLVKLPKEIGDAVASCPHCKRPVSGISSPETHSPEMPSAPALPSSPEPKAQQLQLDLPDAGVTAATAIQPAPRSLPVTLPPQRSEAIPSSGSNLPANRSFNPDAMKMRMDREAWQPKTPELREIDFKDRLARTTDPDMVQGRSEMRYRNHAWESSQKSSSTSWSSWRRALRKMPWGLVGLFIVILALAGYKIWRGFQKGTLSFNQNTASETRPTTPVKAPPSELESRPKSAILADLTPTLKAFVEAQTSAEMKPFVREPERVHALMDAYYQEQENFVPVDYNALPRFDNLFAHKNFVVASLETKQFEPFTISLEKGPTGYLIDWESYVGYGDMPLSTFQKTKPTTPTLFRFIIEPTAYPNFDFPSSETHQAYKLYGKNRSQLLYGYVPRQSPPHEQLMAALLDKNSIYCVLRVKFPTPSTTNNQVEITHYLQTGWVLRGEDYESPASSENAKGVLGN
jgi:hypothetical protein